MSGGNLVEVESASGVWEKAVSIFETTYSIPTQTGSSTPTNSASASPSAKSSIKTNSNLGLGVGLGLGLPIMFAIGVLGCCLLRRRKRRANVNVVGGTDEEPNREFRPSVSVVGGTNVEPVQESRPPVPAKNYGPSVTVRHELGNTMVTKYELSSDLYYSELK